MEFPAFPYILFISFAAGLLAQFIKIVLKLFRNKHFSWTYLDAYGGMPSAHAAFLAALCMAVLLSEGITSPLFAVAAILSAIMIRDAFGVRMIIEKQGKLITKLTHQIQKLSPKSKIKNGRVGRRVGHTLPEVIVGGAIGVLIVLLTFPFFK